MSSHWPVVLPLWYNAPPHWMFWKHSKSVYKTHPCCVLDEVWVTWPMKITVQSCIVGGHYHHFFFFFRQMQITLFSADILVHPYTCLGIYIRHPDGPMCNWRGGGGASLWLATWSCSFISPICTFYWTGVEEHLLLSSLDIKSYAASDKHCLVHN